MFRDEICRSVVDINIKAYITIPKCINLSIQKYDKKALTKKLSEQKKANNMYKQSVLQLYMNKEFFYT